MSKAEVEHVEVGVPRANQAKSRRRTRTIGYTAAFLGAMAATPDAVCVRFAVQQGGTFWWIITCKW